MSADDTKTGMKQGLVNYGDAEFSLFMRKAFIKAMGYSDDALERPIIGVVNTYSGYNACHRNVPELVDAIRRGVMMAGGIAVDFPCDFHTRKLLRADIHVPTQFDGDGRGGNDPRPANGCRRVNRRL